MFLQTRPRLPHTAAMLSSCIDGFIYAWSIHGNGGLLGKFSVDPEDRGNVVGAMATDENDCILLTGDSKGNIKVRKDWCQPSFWPSLWGMGSLSASYSCWVPALLGKVVGTR